jgi:hypothetical protein
VLEVARLRVECLRTGVREVSATAARPGQVASSGGRRRLVARLAPLALPASSRVRLRRLRPEALYKEESGLLVVPLGVDEGPVEALSSLIRELVPPEARAGEGSVAPPVGVRGGDSSRSAARR